MYCICRYVYVYNFARKICAVYIKSRKEVLLIVYLLKSFWPQPYIEMEAESHINIIRARDSHNGCSTNAACEKDSEKLRQAGICWRSDTRRSTEM